MFRGGGRELVYSVTAPLRLLRLGREGLLGLLLEVVVRVRAAVLRVVHAHVLDLRGHAQDAGRLHGAEEDGHRGAHPGEDDAHAGPGGRERAAGGAAVEDARAVVRAVAVVGHRVVVLGREEARGDDAPKAARAVHRDRVDRVVEARRHHALGGAHVDEGADGAHDERARGRHDGAGRRDGHEAREHAVPDVAGVDVVLHAVADERRREAARGRAERRRDGDVGRRLRVAVDVERRAAVEAVPAHPEDEDAERLEHGLALGEVVGEARARAHEEAGAEGRDAARHVHRARAGEVDDAAVAEEARRRAPGRELAGGPHHVHDGRVDEAREHDGVDAVGEERGALGDGAGDDGAARRREGPAEEPAGLGVGGLGRRARREEEAVLAREAVRAVVGEVVAAGAR
mmetsp:Transcript_23417/g.70173  ORF Transcript_23417/g.70173 Transcript_23417/m.70173 type:complete len:401 (+) Transcript_23417:146-1348(+)